MIIYLKKATASHNHSSQLAAHTELSIPLVRPLLSSSIFFFRSFVHVKADRKFRAWSDQIPHSVIFIHKIGLCKSYYAFNIISVLGSVKPNQLSCMCVCVCVLMVATIIKPKNKRTSHSRTIQIKQEQKLNGQREHCVMINSLVIICKQSSLVCIYIYLLYADKNLFLNDCAL